MMHFHSLSYNLNFASLALALTSLRLVNTGLFFSRVIFLYKKTKINILSFILQANFIPTFFLTNLNTKNSLPTSDKPAPEFSGTSLSTNGTPSTKFDITAAMEPGVYAIVDTNSGKHYFGESELVALRLGRHKKALQEGTNDNSGLQRAWDDAADPSKFQFIVLEWGFAWEDTSARKAKEKAIIEAYVSTFGAHACFNTLPGSQQPRSIRRPIMINNTRYNSSRDAASQLKRARTSILRDLRNPSKPDTYYLEKEVFGSIPVFVQVGANGQEGDVVLFTSMKSVIDAGFATSTQMIRRRINSSKFPNWRYASIDSEGKPRRHTYYLQPGEISYEQWLLQQKKE
jgi:GIY-YIG catalytic domain